MRHPSFHYHPDLHRQSFLPQRVQPGLSGQRLQPRGYIKAPSSVAIFGYVGVLSAEVCAGNAGPRPDPRTLALQPCHKAITLRQDRGWHSRVAAATPIPSLASRMRDVEGREGGGARHVDQAPALPRR